jgi:hypothetical protein
MSKKKNREKKKNLKISSNMHKRKQIQESPDLQTVRVRNILTHLSQRNKK